MRLLIIRTSAMGDVALTVPVIKNLAEQYPSVEILLLTKAAYRPFFISLPNLVIIDADFKGIYKGITGLYKLYRDISKVGSIDFVIDLHDVVRTKVLRYFFGSGGSLVHVINKGRKEKRLLIKGKIKGPLKHSVERYRAVLASAGFPIGIMPGISIETGIKAGEKADSLLSRSGCLQIGVAPYAKHKLKMWPEKNMIDLLNLISQKNKVCFYLFGGGREEEQKLESFQVRVPGSLVIAGNVSLEDELALMSKLDFMISMDSSNMHMADLAGTRVISIWGATHPAAGFGAYNQPCDYQVQIPVSELTCRPCTIYGRGTCKRRDKACLNWLTPGIVYEKLIKLRLIS